MNIVEAISKAEIDLVHNLLNRRYGPLYADVWKVGVNLSLRIGDLLSIRFDDLDLANRSLTLREQKTGKSKDIRLNAPAMAVIQRRRKEQPGDVFLFEVHSNRASGKPISRVSVARAIKDVGDSLGLTIGTHSMRKSRGKALFDAGVPIEKISKVLNHASTGVTLRYLGISRAEVLRTYDDFEL